MHKSYLRSFLIMFLFLLPANIFSLEITTGNLLLVSPGDTYRVFLDNKEIGETPLLIDNINKDSLKLQLFSNELYSEYNIKYDSSITSLTTIRPEGVPLYGFLNIVDIPDNSEVFIDTLKQGDEEYNYQLNIGLRQIVIKAPGYYSYTKEIDIEALKRYQLKPNLEKSCIVKLPSSLPDDSRVSFITDGRVIEFKANSEMLFEVPLGEWNIEITSSLFPLIKKRVVLEESSYTLNCSIDYYKANLKIDDIKHGTEITLNGEVLDYEKNTLLTELPPGESTLLIEKVGFLPQLETLTPFEDNIVNIDLNYDTDEVFARSSRFTTGWALVGTGIGLITGGIILNNDDFVIKNTDNYESYSLYKYITLGVACTGAISFLTGTGLISFNIPLGGN